ncbi:VTT domain-containing protein [Pigmentibacter sp. JX0631]|uniref:DedA family protein n=1 Tax=Pigmentibacter sp. JX0631 TaxID=2976982 RepID=UPI0024685E22|nr:VTT domain-containing protein [Pigmentibacter sp. JX0631]WGL60219.1 VTT domain-containing protein [Pigmentibacter sp. JX0631]
MDSLISFVYYLLGFLKDPILLIQTVGYIGLIIIVFAETGLLLGFFLPGDSLLIAAGLFAAKGDMNIVILLVTLTIAGIIGDAVGFYIGRKLGPLLYQKKDSFFFRRKHLLAAHDFYEKHGGKTIILARFIPIIRTFAPTVAGAAEMQYLRFAIFNIVGGFLWVWSMLLAGYFLGKTFGDKINDYIHYLIVGVIIISFLPILIKWLQAKKIEKKQA